MIINDISILKYDNVVYIPDKAGSRITVRLYCPLLGKNSIAQGRDSRINTQICFKWLENVINNLKN